MSCYLYVTNFVDAVNAYVRLGDQSQICTSAATDLGVRGHATGLVNMKKREKDVSLRWPYTFNVCWPAPWGPMRNRREDSECFEFPEEVFISDLVLRKRNKNEVMHVIFR